MWTENVSKTELSANDDVTKITWFPWRGLLKHVSKMDGECSVFKFLLHGVDGKYFLMRWVKAPFSNSSSEIRTEPESVVTANLFFLISWLGQRYCSVLLKPPRLGCGCSGLFIEAKGQILSGTADKHSRKTTNPRFDPSKAIARNVSRPNVLLRWIYSIWIQM